MRPATRPRRRFERADVERLLDVGRCRAADRGVQRFGFERDVTVGVAGLGHRDREPIIINVNGDHPRTLQTCKLRGKLADGALAVDRDPVSELDVSKTNRRHGDHRHTSDRGVTRINTVGHFGGQVMDTVMEIQERHDAVMEVEKGLLELHQIFLDMATLVEQQGARTRRSAPPSQRPGPRRSG